MNGIWKYSSKFSESIPESDQLSLNEGNTPVQDIPELSRFFGLENIYIKREDLNPNGSYKDRSLAFQISYYKNKGVDRYVISSSGNAAVSAIKYVKLIKGKLDVFLPRDIPSEKLKRVLHAADIDQNNLKSEYVKGNCTIHLSLKAKSEAFAFADNYDKCVLIRGSVDDTAIEGYKTIAFELKEQGIKFDSVFLAVSSGASVLGMYAGFENIDTSPAFFIVQTTKIHPIAKEFDNEFIPTKTSISNAISDRVAKRKKSVIEIVNKTKGNGVVVSDAEIRSAQNELLKYAKIEISPDGGVALAGLLKLKKLYKFNYKSPVIVISGK